MQLPEPEISTLKSQCNTANRLVKHENEEYPNTSSALC